jgi:hypothetical protein
MTRAAANASTVASDISSDWTRAGGAKEFDRDRAAHVAEREAGDDEHRLRVGRQARGADRIGHGRGVAREDDRLAGGEGVEPPDDRVRRQELPLRQDARDARRVRVDPLELERRPAPRPRSPRRRPRARRGARGAAVSIARRSAAPESAGAASIARTSDFAFSISLSRAAPVFGGPLQREVDEAEHVELGLRPLADRPLHDVEPRPRAAGAAKAALEFDRAHGPFAAGLGDAQPRLAVVRVKPGVEVLDRGHGRRRRVEEEEQFT